MFINEVFAAEVGSAVEGAGAGGSSTFMFNIGMVAVMFVAFYLILIRPQQRRMQEQQKTLDGLKKGDQVVTAGGLVGKVTKLLNDREIEVELAKDVRVKAIRYTLQIDANDDLLKVKADEAVKDSKAEKKADVKDAEKPVKKPAKKAPKKTAKKADK